jgi:hypothetical protein
MLQSVVDTLDAEQAWDMTVCATRIVDAGLSAVRFDRTYLP